MILVIVFDNQHNCQGYVQFDSLPITGQGEYRCAPDGFLSVESVVEVGRELNRGAISGWIERYHWYRQAKEPGKEPSRDY